MVVLVKIGVPSAVATAAAAGGSDVTSVAIVAALARCTVIDAITSTATITPIKTNTMNRATPDQRPTRI